MSRVYVAVGAGRKNVEKKFVQMMLANNVYIATMGNSTGQDWSEKPLLEIQEGVAVNSRRWKDYTKVYSLIESGHEVVFILPEKGGKHFYRGVASLPTETDVPYLSGPDTYWGQMRAMCEPSKWELEHQEMVIHQVVFPIAGWERVEATDDQKRVMLTRNGSRFRNTFHVILSSPEFDPFSTVPTPAEEVTVGGAVEVEAEEVVEGAVEVAGGGGAAGGDVMTSAEESKTKEEKIALFGEMLKVIMESGSLKLGPIALKIGNLQCEISRRHDDEDE